MGKEKGKFFFADVLNLSGIFLNFFFFINVRSNQIYQKLV